MSIIDGSYDIGYTRCNLSIGDELNNLEKYVIHDDGDKDFNTVIWKLVSGFPITIVHWKERGKKYDDKHMHLVKGAAELKAIREFVGGRVANIMSREVSWNSFSDDEKNFLLNERYLSCLLVECDEEVGKEIQSLI